ncbi:MAG: hypothetical protein EA401_12900 [Planctomycetota bacterium]|nr:MAG: hypothetical protein EA401_12900 [Planctomycetota bacterium]
MSGWDIIGDLHGHADALRRLLERLGYVRQADCYRHPQGRRALFLGDLVDRGPDIAGTVHIVRRMHTHGQAEVIMGNHEINLIAMRICGENGAPLRAHTSYRQKDYALTCAALGDALEDTCEWFRRLPLWLEMDGLRAVHAVWSPEHMQVIQAQRGKPQQRLDDHFMRSAFSKETPLFAAIETVLKGCEVPLPADQQFTDASGHTRQDIRVQWYRRPAANETLGQWSMPPGSIACSLPAHPYAHTVPTYPVTDPPCFFGHYWWTGPLAPLPGHPNLACLDYGVARSNDAPAHLPRLLVAYRFQGEHELDHQHFVAVSA